MNNEQRTMREATSPLSCFPPRRVENAESAENTPRTMDN